MSLFRRLLAWLALAVLGAMAFQLLAEDPGVLVIQLRGWLVETSVAFGTLALLAAIATVVGTLWVLRLPFRLWRRQARHAARARLAEGLAALHEGRWVRAGKLLVRAARLRELRVPAGLAAAQAAHARGDDAAAEAALAEVAKAPGGAQAVGLYRAERLAAAGQPAEAVAALEALATLAPPSPRALELRIESLARVHRAAEAWALLPALKSAGDAGGRPLAALESRLAAAQLGEAEDPNLLGERWDALPRALRSEPAVVAAYALRAADLRLEDAGATAIQLALEAGWDESLAAAYGRLPKGRTGSRLGTAEAWLPAHPASPALLTTLGRICRDEALWGKAEDYLHRAIAQGAGAEAWEVLAEVLAARGDESRARQCYANALAAMRGQAARQLPGRDLRARIQDEAVVEDRDEHGMPRLRG